MQGCPAEATCALALNVPAVGIPIPEHDPIRIIVGLELCDLHAQEADANDFFTEDGKLEQLVRIMAKGKAEPDIERAFVSRCEYDSDEWKTFSKMRKPR